MTLHTIAAAFCIAIAYTTWPILGKYLGAPGSWTSALVVAGSLLAIGVFSVSEMLGETGISTRTIVLLLGAGLANGAAMYFFSVLSARPSIQTGIFMIVLLVCMLITTLVLDWLFNGSLPSRQQLAGAGVAIGAIVLLGNK